MLAEENLLVVALQKCSCVQEMPVLSELPSFGFFVALYVLVLFSAVLFSVGTVFFVWERRKRQHHQRAGAEGSITPFAKHPQH